MTRFWDRYSSRQTQNSESCYLKKNPRIDVRRNSSLFFAVGLVAMLTMVNYAMNYKSYDKADLNLGVIKIDPDAELDIPLLEPMNTPPPP